MNTISVPRRAGDQSGALMMLKGPEGQECLVNVEYNQVALAQVILRANLGNAIAHTRLMIHRATYMPIE